jgi:tetratricopeptide (TPR) repeat protein
MSDRDMTQTLDGLTLVSLQLDDGEAVRHNGAKLLEGILSQDAQGLLLRKQVETCLVTSPPSAQLKQLLDWVQRRVQHELNKASASAKNKAEKKDAKQPEEKATQPGLSWHRVLAAALYRAGRYEDALRRLNEAQTGHGREIGPWNWLFLAMTHHRLGHADEAKKWLEKATQSMDSAEHEDPTKLSVTPRLGWDERVRLQFLRREVEALLAK